VRALIVHWHDEVQIVTEGLCQRFKIGGLLKIAILFGHKIAILCPNMVMEVRLKNSRKWFNEICCFVVVF